MPPKPLQIIAQRNVERLPERKAVTIAVGFLCSDGIVLCTDRQLTSSGGFKYEERKIFRSLTKEFSLIYSYAGDPDAAKILFGKIDEALKQGNRDIRVVLEKLYSDKHSKEAETLIGIYIQNVGAYFFRTKRAKVVNGGYAEYLGVGDSSAVRYVCDVLLRVQPSIEEARILGSYLVSVANRYVEGCGGVPDTTTLWFNGRIAETSGGIFPNQIDRFAECELQIGKALRELLLSGCTKQLGIIEPAKQP